MSHEEIAKLRAAIDHLKEAARRLYEIGTPDCLAPAERIEEMLSHDNGECGLIPLLKAMGAKHPDVRIRD